MTPDAQIAALREELSDFKQRVAVLENQIKTLFEQGKTFVTQAEFGTVKLLTYGIAIAVGGSVMTSLMGKLLIK